MLKCIDLYTLNGMACKSYLNKAVSKMSEQCLVLFGAGKIGRKTTSRLSASGSLCSEPSPCLPHRLALRRYRPDVHRRLLGCTPLRSPPVSLCVKGGLATSGRGRLPVHSCLLTQLAHSWPTRPNYRFCFCVFSTVDLALPQALRSPRPPRCSSPLLDLTLHLLLWCGPSALGTGLPPWGREGAGGTGPSRAQVIAKGFHVHQFLELRIHRRDSECRGK